VPKWAVGWKAEAVRYVRWLWSGSMAEHEAVWGTPPPRELAAFERATLGADAHRTFYELRLNVSQMTNPPEDKNLFEMLVLHDHSTTSAPLFRKRSAASPALGCSATGTRTTSTSSRIRRPPVP
jgi:hypothetical protein